jgi:hypothetical protein
MTSGGDIVRGYILALLVAIVIALGLRFAHGQTPTEWWRLVLAIEAQQGRLDADEKRFIANVKNRLAVSSDAVPTPEHRIWLLHIKKRLAL